MKKITILLLSMFLFFTPIFSFEWGGLISENLRFICEDYTGIDDVYSKQSNGIALWASIPFTNNGDWYLSTQGSYRYNYNFIGFNKDGSFSQIADLDLFKINGIIKISDFGLSLSLGRFFVADNTTKIFAQNCDGFLLKFSNQLLSIDAYCGYTGFINGNNVVTLAKDGNEEYTSGNFYIFAKPYIPISATLTVPSVFLNQTLSFQLNSFLDLAEEKYNRIYGTFCLTGPIFASLYYDLKSCFETENFTSVSNFSTLSFIYFLSNSTFKINCEYASGNQFCFKPFRGFNSSSAYCSFANSEYSSILIPSFDYIFSLNEFCLEVNGKFVMHYPEDKLYIHGISTEIKSVTNIYSDLAFDIKINFFQSLNKDVNENVFGKPYLNFAIGLSLAF